MGASIRGTVRDGQGRPLASVRVVAAHEPTGSQFAKITDDNGRFVFEDIKAGGPYALTASGKGFTSARNRLQLKTDESVDFDLTLLAESLLDDESHTSS